jgi:malto-oligosyltrehalose trehalohydrolase
MVLLDVVYNHFGPEGNYLPACAPIFTDRHETAWGAGVNFDAEGSSTVRELIVSNAIYWLEEYHMDGLRLDAVHAIADDSETHILAEIADRVRAYAGDRHVHLILENEDNAASLLTRDARRRPRRYTAQWNDDLHHVLHTAATGESDGYYRAYVGDTEKLGRALAEGFAFQGEAMPYRGRPRGEPSADLPPTAFVGFIQNHDQIGNRAFGERLASLAPPEALRALAAIYLLTPQIPMLFMGEEWSTARPFPFFCDLGPELADAVREGRRNEFARFPAFRDPQALKRIPDPTDEATFLSAKLDWEAAERSEWRALYRRLLSTRRAEIVPRLRGMGGNSGRYEVIGEQAVAVRWRMGDGARLTLLANLSARPVATTRVAQGRLLWREGAPAEGGLGPWSVRVTLEEKRTDAG